MRGYRIDRLGCKEGGVELVVVVGNVTNIKIKKIKDSDAREERGTAHK